MIKKMHHCQLFAAPGEDPLYFGDFAKVVLQGGPVVERVGDVLALDGCGLQGRQASETVCALTPFARARRCSPEGI